MEGIIPALFAISLLLLIFVGPWILVWRGSLRRKRDRQEDQQRWVDLTSRVYALEKKLSATQADAPEVKPAAPQTVSHPAAEQYVAPLRPVAPPVPSPASTEIPIEAEAAEGPPVEEHEPQVPQPPAPARPPARPPAPVSVPPPRFASSTPSAGHPRSALDLEETLGANWLNKLGIALVVLAVAYFLAYEIKNLGPAGKVLVGLVVSAVMLAAGVWFERSNRYRILARAGVGGGWALLFFTTFAMYHVPAAQVLHSQLLDLVLMLVVAAVMVWHTLHYRSQVVTGLAFLLAFLTVTVSHSDVYSLTAGGVLAVGLVVIVVPMQWFELEVFGILASYLNHYLWLRPIIEPMKGHRHPFPEFAASAGILVSYWLTFRISYVVRRPSDARQERISTIAALLNTCLLLLLLKYQSVHPEWAFWALLAIGAIETALGQLPATRRRRTAVIVLSTLGVVLLVAAFPFRYSGMRLSVLWLLEAEAVLLIGVWTREVVFRRLGALASIVVAGQMISFDAAKVFGERMDGADVSSKWPVAILFAAAAAVFYLNSHWLARRWRDEFTHEFDRVLMRRLTYAGAVMAFIAAWLAFPEAWTAVAWAGLALALSLSGRRLQVRDLRYQGNAFALAAFVRTLATNFDATANFHGVSERLVTVSLVAILFYVSSRWHAGAQEGAGEESPSYLFEFLARDAYTWAASFLLGLLAWYELRPVGVAVAWAIGALVLLETGLGRKSPALRLQAYVAMLAAFVRIFFVNLNAGGPPGEISPRFYTIVPLALAFFYAYERLRAGDDGLTSSERRLHPAEFCCWLGTLSIAFLMRFELPADWVATAWAALAFALAAIAWRSRRRVFLRQSILVAFGVLFRTVLHNFYERSYFPAPPWNSRWVCVGATVALMFASLPILFRLRQTEGETTGGGILIRILRGLGRRPEQVFFFIPVILLTALLALEMRHGMVTLSWGVEGLMIFLLALAAGERSFRLTGLGLLLMCVGKILFVDVWRLQGSDRYLTLFVLGVSLLLVSFLYTRHREAIRQYL